MQVTVVVPTYNEAPNVAELVRRVAAATPSLDLEILFVDDSTDDTPRVIEQVARESGARVGGRLYSDALSAADGPAATYQAMMRHNATLMRDAMVA